MDLFSSLRANDSIRVGLSAANWREAVRMTFAPLVASGAVTEDYVSAVIESTERLGPYYIISDTTAMPHASSAVGVVRDAFCLATFKEPVAFDNDDRRPRVMVGLAATSAAVHTGEALPQVVAVFENPDTERALAEAKSKDEVARIVANVDTRKYLAKPARPLLQIALDSQSVEQAVASAKAAAPFLDVIEAGTILLAAEGKKAVKALREAFPDKLLVADGKIADAGKVFAKMFFESGADYVTCICAAENPTIAAALALARDKQGADVQVELTSHFTWKQAASWRDIGVRQVVYHRSRDSQAAGAQWSGRDIGRVRRLCAMGFKVTVTGGVEVGDLKRFKGLPVYIFIAGRSIRNAPDPLAAAKAFQEEIARLW